MKSIIKTLLVAYSRRIKDKSLEKERKKKVKKIER